MPTRSFRLWLQKRTRGESTRAVKPIFDQPDPEKDLTNKQPKIKKDVKRKTVEIHKVLRSGVGPSSPTRALPSTMSTIWFDALAHRELDKYTCRRFVNLRTYGSETMDLPWFAKIRKRKTSQNWPHDPMTLELKLLELFENSALP